MKINQWIKIALALSAAFVLAACGSGNSGNSGASSEGGEGQTTLTVGASNTPHAEILEFIQPQMEEQGINLQIETFNDYVLPNQALNSGDIDANYYQHVPFLKNAEQENGYDFTHVGGVHLEPLGAYSQEYDSLKDLPENARILVSNNVADYGRVINMLVEAGLLTLKEGVEPTQATFDDIAENPKNLQFETDYDPALMPTLYQNGEGDAVFINSNFAVDNGIDVTEEAIAIESEDSPYSNVVVTRSENTDNEAIQTLMDTLQTEEVANFIEEQWGGSIIPAFIPGENEEESSGNSSSSESSSENSNSEE